MEGEGTPLLRAFSAPGIMREGVIGPLDARAGPPTLLPRATGEPWLRLKLAGGCMRETTGRIPERDGGAAAG